jgi:hypothetical protein
MAKTPREKGVKLKLTWRKTYKRSQMKTWQIEGFSKKKVPQKKEETMRTAYD